MNLGLGNLLELKSYVLPASLGASTEFDTALALLGKGVAGRFDKACNRKFARVEGDVYETDASMTQLLLPRCPVETVTSIEMRTTLTDGWQEQTDLIQNQDDAIGLLVFGFVPGHHSARVRVTYTGGYWFDTSEDPEEPDTMPEGATIVPDDLKLAWLMQCAFLWGKKDKLGLSISKEPDDGTPFGRFDFVPEVREILQSYIRYAIL